MFSGDLLSRCSLRSGEVWRARPSNCWHIRGKSCPSKPVYHTHPYKCLQDHNEGIREGPPKQKGWFNQSSQAISATAFSGEGRGGSCTPMT